MRYNAIVTNNILISPSGKLRLGMTSIQYKSIQSI